MENPQPSLEEVIAAALNEQGYLLQSKVASLLEAQAAIATPKHSWYIEASEVPVALSASAETKIDLILRNRQEQLSKWRLIVECKRAARDFKSWVFFGEAPATFGPSSRNYYIEHANLADSWNGQDDPKMRHQVIPQSASAECPVFEYFVEAKVNLPSNEKKFSATTAIEDAFRQVTLGQAGLALRLRKARELTFHLVPIVVTTAHLYAAHCSVGQISLDHGKLAPSDISLENLRWLAVNFRVSELTCRDSLITINPTAEIAFDLAARQVRTIFVTNPASLESLLTWLQTISRS